MGQLGLRLGQPGADQLAVGLDLVEPAAPQAFVADAGHASEHHLIAAGQRVPRRGVLAIGLQRARMPPPGRGRGEGAADALLRPRAQQLHGLPGGRQRARGVAGLEPGLA